jgi:hypothetical protein
MQNLGLSSSAPSMVSTQAMMSDLSDFLDAQDPAALTELADSLAGTALAGLKLVAAAIRADRNLRIKGGDMDLQF